MDPRGAQVRRRGLKKLLVEELGPDVNLANVLPDDLIDLETTRVGLGVAGPPAALRRR